MNSTLFVDLDGRSYGAEEIFDALKETGAQDCKALFIHSDIMFGNVAAGFNRRDYLQTIDQVFEDLKLDCLLVPTFTFSFCNKEDYDIARSRTSMGAFNEHLRKKSGRYRTWDPLLSLSVPMHLKTNFQNPGEHSLGEGGGLDSVHQMEDVKFLFFGSRLGECFTYVHYVEKMMDVPYRFDMPFSGVIIDEDGNRHASRQYMHTACYGVKPANYYYFEDYLEEKGFLKKKRLGNKYVACLSERDAYREITKMLGKDMNYFLETPFRTADLIPKYTKGANGERVTHC